MARRARSVGACEPACRAIAPSAPCPSTGCGSASSPSRQPALGEQRGDARARPSASGRPAQRAHEGDRLARVHRRIQPAFLGQIADLARGIERLRVAEQRAACRCRVDDPEQHAQGRGLARAIGAEQAENAARRHGQADPVDRAFVPERLHQPAARPPPASPPIFCCSTRLVSAPWRLVVGPSAWRGKP